MSVHPSDLGSTYSQRPGSFLTLWCPSMDDFMEAAREEVGKRLAEWGILIGRT
jgi:hypothetical protein